MNHLPISRLPDRTRCSPRSGCALLLGAIGGDHISGMLRLPFGRALGAAAAFAIISFQPGDGAFGGLYRITPFVIFAKAATYILGAIALFMSGGFLKSASMERYEYSLLVMFASLGAGVMLSANDLMTLYVGIETLSLSSTSSPLQRDKLKSAEAGLKYFVLGALASGLLLLWIIADLWLHQLDQLRCHRTAPHPSAWSSAVLMICGLAFKASAAPFTSGRGRHEERLLRSWPSSPAPQDRRGRAAGARNVHDVRPARG
jgi:NADH-quinone oxidoreductase subunit N